MNQTPNFSSDPEMLSLVIGVALPPLIAIIQQPRWPTWFKANVTAFICIAVGFITCYVEGRLSAGSVLHRVLVILVTALASYQTYWKHNGADWIEKVTSRFKQPANQPVPVTETPAAASPSEVAVQEQPSPDQ
jgi:hypothetical protein